jgi:translocator assembly and maintenance protein 41
MGIIKPLPKKLKSFMVRQFANREWRNDLHQLAHDQQQLYSKIAASEDVKEYVERALRGIVGFPALTQSAKGILTAGPLYSAMYSLDKFKKGFSK